MSKQSFFNIRFSKEKMNERKKNLLRNKKLDKWPTTYSQCICLSQLKYKEVTIKNLFLVIFILYCLPALPILLVNSIILTILPPNLKPGKSSTLLLV
jgi:hypothetical protein